MNTHDEALTWRKSRRCDTNNCVEVAHLATGVALRDSSQPDAPGLVFSRGQWVAFVAGLRAGRWRTV